MQVISVKGMDVTAPSTGPNGEVYVACSSGNAGIRRLAPLPFGAQARALAERGEYAAALELASLMPSSQVQLPDTLLCALDPKNLLCAHTIQHIRAEVRCLSL